MAAGNSRSGKSRVAMVVAVALVALVVWSGRPPTEIVVPSPTLDVPPDDTTQVRAMMDSVFLTLGAPVDTVELSSNHLLLVLQPGAFVDRRRYVSERCPPDIAPDPAMRKVGVMAYRLYGRQRDVNTVVVKTVPRDTVITGGWFHAETCWGAGGTSVLFQGELEATMAVGGRRRAHEGPA